MKNKSLKSETFGIILIVLAIAISVFGYQRIIEFGDFMYLAIGVLVGLGMTFIIFREQYQKIMNRHSEDEWALYLTVFVGLAFILDWATTTYNIPFILTLIAYIPFGIAIGYILRRFLKIR